MIENLQICSDKLLEIMNEHAGLHSFPVCGIIGSTDISKVFAKCFHETHPSMDAFKHCLSLKLDAVHFFLDVFEYEAFNAANFCANSVELLPIMPKPFIHEYLILLPLYFAKIGVDCDNCCFIIDALMELDMANLENFSVIARLLAEHGNVMWPALDLRETVIFQKLLSSKSFKIESLLFIGSEFSPLIVNKFYILFKLALLEYTCSQNQFPSVILPLHCLQTISSMIARSLWNCPESLVYKLFKLFINLVEPFRNSTPLYELSDLENGSFVDMVTTFITASQKIEESSLRKQVVSALHIYVTLFNVPSRVVLIYKVSLNFENDDNASSLLLTWLKRIFDDGEIKKATFPLLFLKSFTVLRSESLLDEFNRHICVINLLIYLQLSKKRRIFKWKKQNSKQYVENLTELIDKTRVLINSTESNEVEVAVGNVDAEEKLTIAANDAKKNQILMNINLFEFRLNTLKDMIKMSCCF